jgi:hypothetical protein
MESGCWTEGCRMEAPPHPMERRMRIATPPTSTGSPGQPRNLQFSGPVAGGWYVQRVSELGAAWECNFRRMLLHRWFTASFWRGLILRPINGSYPTTKWRLLRARYG